MKPYEDTLKIRAIILRGSKEAAQYMGGIEGMKVRGK